MSNCQLTNEHHAYSSAGISGFRDCVAYGGDGKVW